MALTSAAAPGVEGSFPALPSPPPYRRQGFPGGEQALNINRKTWEALRSQVATFTFLSPSEKNQGKRFCLAEDASVESKTEPFKE